MFKKLFLLILFLVITTPAQAVVSWPPEVKPEQGKASGTLGTGDTQLTVNIEFWNVGEVGGYGEVTIGSVCPPEMVSEGCVSNEGIGTFSGGPNGEITANGKKTGIQLVNGKSFKSNLEKTFQANVENPEIFSKYRWSMDESVPDLEIKKGKYEVETIGSARFGDLSGQVEVNMPNPDGTYDEQAWDTAKLDMELPPGTRIIVREKSGLILVFPDTQTNITVGPGTEIILVSPDPQKSKISLPWGILKANVQKMMKDGSMEIEMSQAVAGIKGTQFVLNETKTESSVKVIEGSVSFKSKANGQTEMVNAGETMTADKNGLGQKTTFDVNAENADWKSLESNFGKTSADSKKYLYYLGVPILLVVVAIAFVIKRRKSKV
ncbi:hypothetical protein A3C23_02985 [Candidatus Roizmanbacteria bacterium RIFCSPHIGHO2_02_FULL_37_13b]|uniref:FecR protein domain-containing protein n=1 Tax=Candidatus Roizmanbacteria bacterium RIFCSPLOWO2_02_FULL_36_11 TaxID=1802071 RepID=A0A1F7JI92_9BACT|nr:MAG: hypothetical protein A3C23_02985 [Candidatus Roizmanbacteria bacterium RIFCSPHIGHO2_02_FULL_37_13b]OGK55315.1 MAG: hypothetical protein A3H78_04415 [Candidatus Roizmanbacteria bacterium RIFCSPLOWO2_02_FULL_36_11]